MVGQLFRPVDIRSLAAFRIIFGVVMVAAMARYFAYGWIDTMYGQPQFFFAYEGFEWVRPWPAWGMRLHYAILATLAAGIAAGVAYRASVTLFFLGFTYAHLIDKTNYLNHYYLVSLLAFLMIFMPLGRAWSFDAWRRPLERRTTAPQWMVWLLRFQLGVVYAFAGIAKVDADWLLRAQPLKLWLAAQGDVPLLGPVLVSAWAPYVFSWAGAAFDLTIVFFLLWRRSRPFAYVVVIAFHVVTGVLFPIGLFPWIMIGLTTIFFEPDWPARIGRRIFPAAHPVQTASAKQQPSADNDITAWTGLRGVAVASLLAAWVVFQVATPLRFLTRDGDVKWTEDGFRFAWRVMLIEKRAAASFELRDPATGKRTEIDPQLYLTPSQAHMMATQPDMILQFAHWLATRERQHGREVEVRARVDASLNGRPHRPLVDARIDLTKIEAASPVTAWTRPLL